MGETNGANQTPTAYTMHPDYNLPGGDWHIIVEDTLFCVHSYFFTRESPKFKDLTPITESDLAYKVPAGATLLRLEHVKPCQFANFLWLIYDPNFSRKGDVEHWTSILDFAERWLFPNVKAVAVQALEGLTILTVERIVLYQKYHVTAKDIIHPHYETLCKRAQPLSLAETFSLGPATTHIIFSIREALLRSHRNVNQLDKKTVLKAIDDYFNADNKGASDEKKSPSQSNGSSTDKDKANKKS